MKNKLAFHLLFFICLPRVYSEEQAIHFSMNSDNRPIVFGTVHNTTGYFIIDTGSPSVILFDPIQDLPEADAAYNSYALLGETFESKTHVVSGVTLGAAVIEEKFAVIQAPETIKNVFSSEIKGIINILALDKIVEISFSKRTIRLLDRVPERYKESVSFIRQNAVCFIPVRVGGVEYLFRVDTGSDEAVDFPEIVLDAIDKKNILHVAATADNTATNNSDYYIFKNHDFVLFNHVYKNSVCRTNTLGDKKMFGAIGTQVLQRYDMAFDPAAHTLFYKPLLPDILYDIFFNHTAYSAGLLNFDYTQEALIVKEVITNSPVWKAGLRPGHKITKINDQDASGTPQTYMARILQSNSAVKIEYYGEDNKKKTVKVKPKVLLK
ncbi:MAG: hypothetical protein LBG43_10590 [Treponema sp.]|jgi:hypothetical protein|nr:hypothetical protein [Treponema sp.]